MSRLASILGLGRLLSLVSLGLLVFGAVADNQAICEVRECACEAAPTSDGAPPLVPGPAESCAARPCRTPVCPGSAAQVHEVVGTVSTFIPTPARPLLSTEPAAPPTPPPISPALAA